jgi:hypothetical protein
MSGSPNCDAFIPKIDCNTTNETLVFTIVDGCDVGCFDGRKVGNAVGPVGRSRFFVGFDVDLPMVMQ